MKYSAKQLIQEYHLGERKFKGLILEADSNLTYAILTDADFSGADFSRSNLSGVDFSRSNFNGSTFINSDLSNAIFIDANLQGSNLECATLRNVNFKNTLFSSETRFPYGFHPFLFKEKSSTQDEKIVFPENSDIAKNIQKKFGEKQHIYLENKIADLKLYFETEVEDIEKYFENDISELQLNLLNYENRLKVVEVKLRSIYELMLPLVNNHSKDFVSYIHMIEKYNEQPSSLASYALGVSQTKESLKICLQNPLQHNVILAQDDSPNYWIVKDKADNLWLFPREGWEPSIGTLESFVRLFKFTGNPSRRYRVIKPASVIETGQRDWSLKEPGEIEFS